MVFLQRAFAGVYSVVDMGEIFSGSADVRRYRSYVVADVDFMFENCAQMTGFDTNVCSGFICAQKPQYSWRRFNTKPWYEAHHNRK